MKNNRLSAYPAYIIAMVIFGTIGIFRKFIPISSELLVCARGLVGGCFLLVMMLCQKERLSLGGNRKTFALVVITGLALGGNWILLFESYRYTSVSVATLCYYMQPTILILLSPWLFGEKLTLKKLICAVISVLGMICVSGVVDASEQMGANDIKGICLGLGAAVLYAIVVILNKKVTVPNVKSKTMVELFSFAIILLPYLLLTQDITSVKLDPLAAILIVVVGVLHTGVAYTLYLGSMNHLSSQTVAILSYIDPVLAVVFSFALLGERMTVVQLLGGVLIIGAAVACEIKMRKKHGEEGV